MKTVNDPNHQGFVLGPVLDGWETGEGSEGGHHSWALNVSRVTRRCWSVSTHRGSPPPPLGLHSPPKLSITVGSGYLTDPLSLLPLGSVFWAFPQLLSPFLLYRKCGGHEPGFPGADSSVSDSSPALYCVMEARRNLYL